MYKFQQCECGSTKIENKETSQCASCNKARRMAEKPPKTKKQYVGLKPVSAKKSIALAAKKRAYNEVDKLPQVCVSCGTTQNLTHSHVLTVKQFPQHEANPDNILIQCLSCHQTYENDKYTASQTQPSWPLQMEIMQRLEPEYYEFFKVKYPALFDH